MEKPKNNNSAKRLLDNLKNPALLLASELPPKNSKPHPHLSETWHRVVQEVERLSGGRYSVTKDQNKFDVEPEHDTLIKVYDHKEGCGHFSWLSLLQMTKMNKLDQWCCYCSEPLSFKHIGPDLVDVQRFVETRSGGKTFFSTSNELEGASLCDVVSLNCLAPSCKGMHYSTTFAWFLNESEPAPTFLSPPPTCGCPACTEALIRKMTGHA